MADAASKREARRRRILENSANRLQKITGRIRENSVEEKTTEDVKLQLNVKPCKNNLCTEERVENLIDSLSEGATLASQESSMDFESNQTLDRHTFSYQETVQNLKSSFNIDRLHEEIPNPPIQKDFSTFDNYDLGSLSQPSKLMKQSSIYSMLFNDISYLGIAFVVNIFCLLNLDHLFGKTILLPYFTMTIARLLFHESWQEPQESSIMIAALILCNVNPRLIQKFRRTCTMFSKIFRGFALYIFSFVMIRWGFSQFFIELDMTPSNSIPQ